MGISFQVAICSRIHAEIESNANEMLGCLEKIRATAMM